jgi:hypothetical protein
MRRFPEIVSLAAAALAAVAVCTADAQPPVARPQPPPAAPNAKAPAKPGTAVAPAPAATQPAAKPPAAPPATAAATKPSSGTTDGPPAACQQSGAPVLAGAQYLEAYEAGLGQYFCLYGSAQAFADVVAYYRTALKDRGELVFDVPATHMFEVGRFKETEVAFPPGVTVKDYTSGGSPGYTNPRPASTPAFFPTIIQIVPPPPALAGRRD